MQPRKRLISAQINDQSITVERGETVLQAALRHGIEFPSSCRVGGCGTCKCRLTAGTVKELTETGYLLTADEIDQGYILACQSVPRSDIRVAVDLSARASQRSVAGRVVAQRKVTHDITSLCVQLDEPMPYRAGQFANVGIEGLDGVVRSYSFATPARDDGQVTFLVRKVPGGRFSSLVNDQDVVGRSVRVDGPSGDFWLRPSGAPLLLVAGGSGLAPILAILQEALSAGVSRSVTLLFGAREARDLYALEEIESIARQWRGAFRFVPVLSAAGDDATWTGERGLVTEKIPGLLEPGSHALLCGPPAMIDGAVAVLRQQGVRREHIHFDRFTTQADVAISAEAAESGPPATWPHYIKYFATPRDWPAQHRGARPGRHVPHGRLAGRRRDLRARRRRQRGRHLHAEVPAPGRADGAALDGPAAARRSSCSPPCGASAPAIRSASARGSPALTGYDVLAARDATTFVQHVSAWIITGLMIGLVGTIPAHELTHRTWDRISMCVGRWLLAFSFDTTFAIEHVYGHHRYVSTAHDPATAPRGRNVYFHIVASTLKGNVSAWHIEVDRLGKKRLGRYSWHNALIRGHLMSAAARRRGLRHGRLERRGVLHGVRARGQVAARDRQLHGALRHGPKPRDAGAAPPFLEHQPAHQLVDHVQPDAALPPPRAGRGAVPGSPAVPGRADDDQRLPDDHPRRDDPSAVAPAHDPEGARVGSRLCHQRGAQARGRRERPQRHPAPAAAGPGSRGGPSPVMQRELV